jgi:fatty acid-binding protein DegV
VEKIEEYVKSLRIIFTLASFDTIVKNGRMSKISAILASTLNIRAVARGSEQGEIQMVAKPRGERKALECITNLMGEYKEIKDNHVIISHCNNMPAALSLKELIISKYRNNNITIIPMKGVISYYATNLGLTVSF